MAKKPSFNFSEQWFRDRGYTQDINGAWNPPALKSEFARLTKAKNVLEEAELVVKEKVNNSPDFNSAPTTEWFIPYQVPSKKNCQQLYIKRLGNKIIPATTTSKRYKDYVTATKMYWETFGKEFKRSVERLELSYPLRVQFTFIRSTQQEVDYVGPLESVQDIMQDFGWLPKDDYKHIKPILGDMEVLKNNAGVRIKLMLTK